MLDDRPDSDSASESLSNVKSNHQAADNLSEPPGSLQSRFFDMVWAPGWHTLCAGLGDKFAKVGVYQSWEQMLQDVPEGVNVWFERNGGNSRPLHGSRNTEDSIGTSKALACDLDWADPAHADPGLLSESAVVAAVESLEIMPTFVVHTGHGYQLYWCTGDIMDARTAAGLQQRLGQWLRSKTLKPEGLDLARILRLPGTMNVKTEPHLPVFIEYETQVIYTSGQLDGLLPPLEEPAPRVAATERRSGQTPVQRALAAAPSSSNAETPAQWFVRNVDFLGMLLADGWTESSRKGDSVFLTRPGKNAGDGKSARLYLDGTPVLVIYSSATELDELRTRDTVGRGETARLDAFEYFAIKEHHGDKGAAAAAVRREMMPQPVKRVADRLVLADDWWDAPWLEHVRMVARARDVNETALLACLLVARNSTIGPNVTAPDVGFGRGSLNTYMCLVGPPAGGKSVTLRALKDMYRWEHDPTFASMAAGDEVMDDGVKPGSSAGLIDMFYGNVDDVDDPGKMLWTFIPGRGRLMIVDEAAALLRVGSKNAAAWEAGVPGLLREMFMGVRVGTNNKRENTRHLEEDAYRFCLIAGLQPPLAVQYVGDSLSDLGDAQRLPMFDVTPTHEELEDEMSWPGEIALPRLPPRDRPIEVTIDEEVRAAYRARMTGIRRGRINIDRLETHDMFITLKLAVAFASCDTGELHVSQRAWDKASDVMSVAQDFRKSMLKEFTRATTQKKVAARRAEIEVDEEARHDQERRALQAAIRIAAAQIERGIRQGKIKDIDNFAASYLRPGPAKYRHLTELVIETLIRLDYIEPREPLSGRPEVRYGLAKPLTSEFELPEDE